MLNENDPRPVEETAPERRPRTWLRWLGIGVAAAVLIFGVVSLVASLSRRAGAEQAAEIDQLKKIISSEEEELKQMQSDYDDALELLEKKQAEYDEVRKKLDSGVIENDAAGQQSLDQLRAAAEQTQMDYSAALAAYETAVDTVEQTVASSDAGKKQLEALEPFVSYAAAYEQFAAGTTDALPGIAPEEDGQAPDAQSWYAAVVLPAATQAGITLPDQVDAFPAAVQALTAEPSAKVKAYDDALAASKAAEAKLSETNAAQEATAKAYADGKAAQRTSEDWLSDCAQEIDRLQKRVRDLEDSIYDVNSELEDHRAALKKLENK